MSEPGEVYSTKQVADSLGLGSAMIRKYAVALEKITGDDIPIKRRDGRQFSREHFDTISAAKALVESNKGLNIETALKMALGNSQMPQISPALQTADRNTLDMAEAISEAIKVGNADVIAELRELRHEVKQLRIGSFLPPEKIKSGASEHGFLVKAAVWFEGILKR